MAIGALMALVMAAPAAAKPNANPRIESAWSALAADGATRVVVKGRDRDDVVRGIEIAWGEGQPEQGQSACARGDAKRRGRLSRFELTYAYPAPGTYHVTVRVLSGGCGKRAQQRSAPQTLTVYVD
jgi:hypothetical protein